MKVFFKKHLFFVGLVWIAIFISLGCNIMPQHPTIGWISLGLAILPIVLLVAIMVILLIGFDL